MHYVGATNPARDRAASRGFESAAAWRGACCVGSGCGEGRGVEVEETHGDLAPPLKAMKTANPLSSRSRVVHVRRL